MYFSNVLAQPTCQQICILFSLHHVLLHGEAINIHPLLCWLLSNIGLQDKSFRLFCYSLLFFVVAACKVESHEPRWAKNMFLKEASWAHHYSVMARIRIALTFDTTEEVRLTSRSKIEVAYDAVPGKFQMSREQSRHLHFECRCPNKSIFEKAKSHAQTL